MKRLLLLVLFLTSCGYTDPEAQRLHEHIRMLDTAIVRAAAQNDTAAVELLVKQLIAAEIKFENKFGKRP